MDERATLKSTNAEIELRVSIVSEMLIKGQGRGKIIRYGSENWNVGERQIENYIAKAWEKIEKNTDYDIRREIQLQRARFEDLFQKNYTIQDYREARQVLDSIAKLLGLNEPEKHRVEHSGEIKVPQTLAELYDEERNSADTES